MKIEHQALSVRDLVSGLHDDGDGDGGVVGCGGALDIRPLSH